MRIKAQKTGKTLNKKERTEKIEEVKTYSTVQESIAVFVI